MDLILFALSQPRKMIFCPVAFLVMRSVDSGMSYWSSSPSARMAHTTWA